MTRQRVDWMPGAAALEALAIAGDLLPHLSRQELIDRLVITGLAALKQPPLPQLFGDDRDRWALPSHLRLGAGTVASRKDGAPLPGTDGDFSRERVTAHAHSRIVCP